MDVSRSEVFISDEFESIKLVISEKRYGFRFFWTHKPDIFLSDVRTSDTSAVGDVAQAHFFVQNTDKYMDKNDEVCEI